ncbi:hypothetical protein KPC83_00710 [Collinsella sp. zg1085]|uniref:hypothetical protein n=1 Tax=Collinsella sp. zg1085 TaxID=2844380 RepID=UPI001C0A9FC7|nr:hypothetical protein [Collinsella sp. zg1085]QWT17723.1 hypothetical protein KPC83_00710 [Collinsella sp. zg1085]
MHEFIDSLVVHAPMLAAGLATGVVAFGALMLALIPVLRRHKQADLTRGLLGLAISVCVLAGGAFIAWCFVAEGLSVFIFGEALSLLLGWVVLAGVLLVRS